MPLTALAIKQAKPDPERALKLYDEKGLLLLVQPSGARYETLVTAGQVFHYAPSRDPSQLSDARHGFSANAASKITSS